MSEQLALLPELAMAHLQLALFALTAGCAMSVPLGIWGASIAGLSFAILAS